MISHFTHKTATRVPKCYWPPANVIRVLREDLTYAVFDHHGRYVLPWTFDENAVVRVVRERRYLRRTIHGNSAINVHVSRSARHLGVK